MALMVTFYLCLLFGFFIIIPGSYELGIFWLILSCVTYLPMLYLPFLNKDRLYIKLYETEIVQRNLQNSLILVLTLVLPLFTVNYFISLFGVIDAAMAVSIYQILSVVTKGFFSAHSMDILSDFAIVSERRLQSELIANESRRSFMKFIFHEVPMLYLQFLNKKRLYIKLH